MEEDIHSVSKVKKKVAITGSSTNLLSILFDLLLILVLLAYFIITGKWDCTTVCLLMMNTSEVLICFLTLKVITFEGQGI